MLPILHRANVGFVPLHKGNPPTPTLRGDYNNTHRRVGGMLGVFTQPLYSLHGELWGHGERPCIVHGSVRFPCRDFLSGERK